MQRNTIISIVVTAIVLYVLDFIYYSATMAKMMEAMPAAYKAAQNTTEPNPAIWLVMEFMAAILFWIIVGRDSSRPINMKSAAMSCAVVYGLVSAMMGFYMMVTIAGWQMQGEIINTAYSIVVGGIAGYVMSMVHNKLSKA